MLSDWKWSLPIDLLGKIPAQALTFSAVMDIGSVQWFAGEADTAREACN